MKKQFSNGHKIVEPQDYRNCLAFPYTDACGHTIFQPIEFEFEDDNHLFSHVLKHIVSGHDTVLWDDLGLISQNELLRIQRLRSVRQILSNHPNPIDRITNKEAAVLRRIPQFTELAERYKGTLSNILGECINHVRHPCRIFNPHCHFLKSNRKDGTKFAQKINILDAQSGIFIAAIAPYANNPNSGVNFENSNEFIIKTGFRVWRSKTSEKRTKKFKRSEKELNLKIRKLSSKRKELKQERNAYPRILDIKKHLPRYICNIVNSVNIGK